MISDDEVAIAITLEGITGGSGSVVAVASFENAEVPTELMDLIR